MAMSSAESEAKVEASADARASARGRRAGRADWILGAVVAAGVLAYAGVRAYSAGKEGTDDAQVDADVVPVAARISGAVLAVRVRDNQAVKKGDVILEIDARDYQAKLKQRDAE